MNGNGKHTTYKNGDDRGMVYEIVLPTLSLFGMKFSVTPSHGWFDGADGIGFLTYIQCSNSFNEDLQQPSGNLT